MKPIQGEYRRDRWGLCWCYTGVTWEPLTDAQGVQVFPPSSFETVPGFCEGDDPSSLEDPQPSARMERIEDKLNQLLVHFDLRQP